MSFMEKLFGNFSDKELKRINPIANKVLELEPEMQKLTDEELQAKTPYLKETGPALTISCPKRAPSAAKRTGVCWA